MARRSSSNATLADGATDDELCHLRESNHSKALCRLLDAARPGWQEQARWLREHSQELHDYRPSAAFRSAI